MLKEVWDGAKAALKLLVYNQGACGQLAGDTRRGLAGFATLRLVGVVSSTLAIFPFSSQEE